jgi:hypothetical protein
MAERWQRLGCSSGGWGRDRPDFSIAYLYYTRCFITWYVLDFSTIIRIRA